MLSPLLAGPWALESLVKAVKNGAPLEGEYRDTIELEGLFFPAYNLCVIGKYPARGYYW